MKQRIQTAIIALIIFVPLVIYGGWPFTIFTYIMATIGVMELMKMNKSIQSKVPSFLAIGFLWILLLPTINTVIPNFWFTKQEFIIVFIMVILSYTVLSKNTFTFDNAGFLLLATAYVGMGFFFLIQIRMAGLSYILYALFVIWATDTGAYFFGRAFGKRKLWPEISPNKTMAGAIGGIIVACIVAISFQLVYPFELSLLAIVGMTIVVSIVGQIGDLVASAFKRHYEIKDSGTLLPGHGGILDRMDSLLFVLPLLHLFHFIL